MAQYRATIQGNRSEASRLGHKTSGMVARVNGWHSGVKVIARYDKESDSDIFEVYKTSGSNGAKPDEHVITLHS